MRRLLGFMFCFLLAGPALAAGNLADIEIYDRASGRSLPVHESGGRWYVAGKPGNEYQVTVRNRSGGICWRSSRSMGSTWSAAKPPRNGKAVT